MSSGSTLPFKPSGTVTIAATTTPSTAALVGTGDAVLIVNAASSVALVSFGAGPTDAAANVAVAVPPGSRMLVHSTALVASAGVTLTAGTGNVYITTGSGTVY